MGENVSGGKPVRKGEHSEMTKSFEQIAESIALRIGHIYFPL